MKYARRTFAIVSTISIPHPAPISPMEAIVNPPSRGSRLDADHPQNGGLIPCRFTAIVPVRPIAGLPLHSLWPRPEVTPQSRGKLARDEPNGVSAPRR